MRVAQYTRTGVDFWLRMPLEELMLWLDDISQMVQEGGGRYGESL
ncbi:hypothetical protein RBH88_03255 [Aminobacterium sp. MB27-C1]|nr:hypothetical protein [Aminobacterium sp. MB27-C1]WMI72131.1 hypothetical protein RBH88_03255 [Aminobacterium sp. MB27-C1]